jgi:hypothetical protein
MNNLTPNAARELLQMHAGRHEDVDHPKWRHGFLGSLRPFSGLRIENFHEVMKCIEVLTSELENQVCDREVLAAIWGICHLGRAWGVEAQGMLQRNNLIAAEDVERLESWITQISYTTFCLLDGCGSEVAFEGYDDESI